MAIVKMKRLTLIALNADRDDIYNAIARCGLVQLKRTADIDSLTAADKSQEREKILSDIARVEEAITFVSETAERYNAAHKGKGKVEVPKNGFARPKTEIDFDCYLGFGQRVSETERSLAEIYALKNKLSALTLSFNKYQAELSGLKPYLELTHPASWYRNTETAVVQLSQLPSDQAENLLKLAEEYQTVTVERLGGDANLTLAAVVAHKSESAFFERATALGLTKCPLSGDVLPRVTAEDIERRLNGISQEISRCVADITGYAEQIPQWKVYVDWLLLCDKKLAADGDVRESDFVFVLEGFYPAESEEKVASALESVTDKIVLRFYEIADDEFAPTLVRNNKFTQPFESVTNSYSVPDYHEVDPNPVMSVFYFIIFGLMVADIGYGAVLLALGIFATFAIKQKTGLKVMLQMFGICGVSAMVVGALFGSVFGYTFWDKIFADPAHPLHSGIIPNPADYPMVMMILSLLFGVVHLAAGIACNMAVKIKHKQYLSAWLADFPWIIVFLGFVLAIFNLALDMAAYEPYNALRLPDIVSQIALYVCLAALAVALVCAGLGTKGFLGKVIKSFGSAYGIINYFSDIMSYIRVFGLMLSSAIMASVVNQLGAMVSGNGGFGYVLAALVLVFAHIFNLAMGVLSVYIHNGRLQYVEFFGKFYTGDGQLFVPFGSDAKYSLIKYDSVPNGSSAVK